MKVPAFTQSPQTAGKDSSGNALLELALFIPLGFLLVLGAVDVALSFGNASATRELVAASLNSQLQSLPVFATYDVNGVPTVDESALRSALLRSLQRSYSGTAAAALTDTATTIVPLRLTVDNTSGTVLAAETIAPTVQFPTSFSPPTDAQQKARRLAQTQLVGSSPSPYALRFAYENGPGYEPYAHALFVRIESYPRLIGGRLTSALRATHSIDEQSIHPFRLRIR